MEDQANSEFSNSSSEEHEFQMEMKMRLAYNGPNRSAEMLQHNKAEVNTFLKADRDRAYRIRVEGMKQLGGAAPASLMCLLKKKIYFSAFQY
ncbi:Hypothetical predicted protein [Pelobates cultripes]|uniref:Uncharacterized protein n=1 Tax=Pelobates cultripes TaxID=61616 RepID=A0AAD1RLE3_PELCU|nr:Hypothetical predicted protein [Pelobates cultripes]